MPTTERTIRLLLPEAQAPMGARPSLEGLTERVANRVAEVAVGTLASNLHGVLSDLFEAINSAPPKTERARLSKVSCTLAIDGEGRIALLSAFSGQVAGHATLSFELAIDG